VSDEDVIGGLTMHDSCQISGFIESFRVPSLT
ncbi:uncharacterized protein METZ01_LOCUS188301, partial [marine metagenome]